MSNVAPMRLTSLLMGIAPCDFDIAVQDITLDSRSVRVGSAFFALSGTESHGLTFVDDAVARGAAAIVYEDGAEPSDHLGIPSIRVVGLRDKLGIIASRFFGTERARVIGITGTDGKTTTAHVIAQLLSALGRKTGTIGTMGYGIGDHLLPLANTTPDVISVHRYIAEMTHDDAEFIAMEVSSHGLVQQRIANVPFIATILTNLGRDHLDYHGTHEAYALAKQKLFELPSDFQVVNSDDEFGASLPASPRGIRFTYALSDSTASLVASNLELSASATRFTLKWKTQSEVCETTLVGRFNVYNLLAAIGLALLLGEDLPDIARMLPDIQPVTGRMQRFARPGFPVVIVDFAHTPAALENALTAISGFKANSLCVVFGCGGNRDRGKRPQMARVVERYADMIVVTNDNPRHEDPEEIIKEVTAGFSDMQRVTVEPDRRSAIKHAIECMSERDVVLIAGKGHEQYQIVGDHKLPYSDQLVVQQVLEAA